MCDDVKACGRCGGAGRDVVGERCRECRGSGTDPAPCEGCGEPCRGRYCGAHCEAKHAEYVSLRFPGRRG